MEFLPKDLVSSIVDYLSIDAVLILCKSNKHINKICQTESFWNGLYRANFGSAILDPHKSYKKQFKERYTMNNDIVVVLASMYPFEDLTHTSKIVLYNSYLKYLGKLIPAMSLNQKDVNTGDLTVNNLLQAHRKFVEDRSRMLRSFILTAPLSEDLEMLMIKSLSGFNTVRKTNYKFLTPNLNVLSDDEFDDY